MTLDELINEYGVKKPEVDKSKKELDKLSAEIKSIMRASDSKHSTDFYTATFSTSERTSMNEEKAIKLLKGSNIEDRVIKTKLYVDTDALEDLIYRGEVDKDLIAKLHGCVEVKVVESLRVTKKKGDK